MIHVLQLKLSLAKKFKLSDQTMHLSLVNVMNVHPIYKKMAFYTKLVVEIHPDKIGLLSTNTNIYKKHLELSYFNRIFPLDLEENVFSQPHISLIYSQQKLQVVIHRF